MNSTLRYTLALALLITFVGLSLQSESDAACPVGCDTTCQEVSTWGYDFAGQLICFRIWEDECSPCGDGGCCTRPHSYLPKCDNVKTKPWKWKPCKSCSLECPNPQGLTNYEASGLPFGEWTTDPNLFIKKCVPQGS